jgi:hypothetical protein
VSRANELIGRTTTKTGLKVERALDEQTYETGIRISKAEMRQLASSPSKGMHFTRNGTTPSNHAAQRGRSGYC